VSDRWLLHQAGFQAGDKVAAFMSGMGRTINGSYSELTLVRATNVVKVTTDLSWEDFAVVPESYATAWTCLYGNNIRRIQLNRPAKKKAMTSSMYLSLADLINSAARHDQIRVVLCHGAVCQSLQVQQ